MAKKLLSEAQVRRFAKLANLSPVNEMYNKRDEDELEENRGHMSSGHSKNRDQDEKEEKMDEGSYMKRDDEEKMEEGSYMKRDDDEVMNEEDPAEEMAADAADAAMDDLPSADEDELEMEAGDSDLELSQDMVDAIAAALPALQMIADAADGGEKEMDMDMDMEMGMDEEPPAEMEEELMETADEVTSALEEINLVPETSEIVEEVARRVAKRLLKAKKNVKK